MTINFVYKCLFIITCLKIAHLTSYTLKNTYDLVYPEILEECLHEILKLVPQDGMIAYILCDDNPNISVAKNMSTPFLIMQPHRPIVRKLNTESTFVIFLEIDTLRDTFLFHLIKSNIWNNSSSPRGKFFVFVPQKFRQLQQIYKLFWEYDIMDVTIFVKSNMSYKVYHTDPYAKENMCGKIANVEEIGICNKDIIYKLMKKKDSKLYNCSFVSALINIMFEMPYIGNPTDKYPGLFISPLELISERLGVNMIYINVSTELQLEFLDKSLEVEKVIVNKSVDTCVTVHYRGLREYQLFDLTDVYFYDTQVWVISKPNQIPNVQVLTRIFKLEAWIGVGSVVLLVTLVWWSISLFMDEKYFKNLSRCFFDSFVLLLGVGIPKTPHFQASKVLILLYMLYSIHISYYFQGTLSGMLTKPGFERGLLTIEEMSESVDVTPMTYVNIWKSFQILEYPTARKLYNRTELIKEAVLTNLFEKMIKYQNVSATAYYSEITSKFRDKLRILGGNFLLDMEPSYVIRKGHPFLVPFNTIINRMHEGGLPLKWRAEVTADQNFDMKSNDEKIILSLDHLQGAFILLVLGLLLSISIFIIEIITKKLCLREI